MTPRIRLLLAGASLLVAAVFSLLGLATAYWPFQSVVQVIAPFLVVSVLASVGTTLVLVACVVPGRVPGASGSNDSTSVVDALLSEMKRKT